MQLHILCKLPKHCFADRWNFPGYNLGYYVQTVSEPQEAGVKIPLILFDFGGLFNLF